MPRFGGEDCKADPKTNEFNESTIKCPPIDGQWADWTPEDDSECQENKDIWQKRKLRNCSNPEPKFGGEFCHSDPSSGDENVTIIECPPVNGNWSDWTISG